MTTPSDLDELYYSFAATCLAMGAFCAHQRWPWGILATTVGSYIGVRATDVLLKVCGHNCGDNLAHKAGLDSAITAAEFTTTGFVLVCVGKRFLK